MSWKRLKDVLTHPLTAFTSLVTALLTLGGPLEPIFHGLNATSHIWYSGAVVFGMDLAPRIGFIPNGMGETLFLGASVLFVLLKVDALVDWVHNRYFADQ